MNGLNGLGTTGSSDEASDSHSKPGEGTSKRTDAKATAYTGGRPPVEPPHIPGSGGGSGGNSSGGGFKKWAEHNKGWAFILGLTGILLAIIVLFVINDFFTERQIERLERLNRLTPAPNAAQPQRPLVVPPRPTVTAKQTVEFQDGTTPTLPENARIVLHGPITNMVIVNSASRIKSFSGEFKLVLKADGTRAWTSGFNSKPTPNSMQEFIDRLPKPPEQSEVWIFVPPGGILELNT